MYGAYGPVEAQFAHQHILSKLIVLYVSACGQDGDGKRQVVGGAFLADVGRSHVDGVFLRGDSADGVLYGSRYAV